jgi:hypothetical protein
LVAPIILLIPAMSDQDMDSVGRLMFGTSTLRVLDRLRAVGSAAFTSLPSMLAWKLSDQSLSSNARFDLEQYQHKLCARSLPKAVNTIALSAKPFK